MPGLNCLVQFANFMKPSASPMLADMPGQAPCPLPNGQIPGEPFVNFNGVAVTFYGVALARSGYVDGQAPLNNQFPLDTTSWANAYPTQLTSSYQYKLNHAYYGFFAQDQWRLTPKLTVNYGLRYDLETGLGAQIAPYYGAIQPRVGLAYAPDNKTVIRAGFGMFDDRNNMTFFFITGDQKTVPGYLPGVKLPMVRTGADTGGWQLNAVNTVQVLPGGVTCTPGLAPFGPFGPCFDAPADVAKLILNTGTYPIENITGDCPPACTAGAGGMDRNHSKVPYAEQASMEIDRQIGKSTTVDIGYLFVGAHRLILGNGLNTSCPQGTNKPNNPGANLGPPQNSSVASQGWLNPDGTISNCVGTPLLLAGKPVFQGNEYANGGFMDYNDAVVNANYHGLTLQAIERLGKFFSLNANYTWSHIIDDGNFTTFINLPQNQFDNKSERANSNQDVRHRFIANFTASTPDHGIAKNFELSSVITIQSGRPFTMFVGGDANGDTNPVTDRVGLSGRNSYIGQPLRSWDLRVSRHFQLTERMRLDFMFDAFNLLNRQNIDEVFSVYGSPIFCGPVPQHYGDAASLQAQAGQAACPAFTPPAGVVVPATFAIPPTANNNFGTPRTMLNPRQLQFALKFSF